MAVSLIEFCTPPVPGQSHKFYGNAHNNFIKLPITLQPVVPEAPSVAKSAPSNKANSNSLHSIVASGNLTLLNNILSVLPSPQKAVNDPHPITGLTPLHFASSRGHFEIVQCLVEQYSAIVDAKDKEGEVKILKFFLMCILKRL
jgi:ankyrin repeat protein